jgi:thiol-disulfide isomerase/thioredoxin
MRSLLLLLMLIFSIPGPAFQAQAPRMAAQETGPGTSIKQVELQRLPASVCETQLRALRGRPIKLSSYSGRVLLVNLWATWCGPCRFETPELVKLHKKFRSQGVAILGLSTEVPNSPAGQVRRWVRHFGVDYRIGWAPPEFVETLMQGRDAIPQTFVISRDGRIVKRFIGYNPVNTPPQLSQATKDALNDLTSRPISSPVVVNR